MGKDELIQELINEKGRVLDYVNRIEETISILRGKSYQLKLDNVLREFLDKEKAGNRDRFLKFSSKLNSKVEEGEKYEGYFKARSLKEKIKVILKGKKQCLHIRDLADILSEIEIGKTKDELVIAISPLLSVMAKNNDEVCKVQVTGNKKDTLWGLEIWKDKNGNIPDDYLI